MSRWVLVDDTDSGISYVGPWFADKGSQDALGNFGPPYLSTLHGVNSPASFSYTFRGSRVLITSTVQFPTVGNVTNPSFQCIVDGEILGSLIHTDAENRLRLCEKDGLDDDLHTITVRVDVSDAHTFWLDYIQYLPFPDTPLDTAAISVDTTDAQILLGGWIQKFPGYITQRTDSTFSFQFYGISLMWLGFYDNSLPMDLATATYSIDGQTPVPFNLDGSLAKTTGVQYNQVFFVTPKLEAKTHILKVSYQGDTSKTPLSLDILQIQNGTSFLTGSGTTTAPSGVTSSTISLPAAPTGSSPTHTASKSTTPAIIGGVLGGVSLLLILCISGIIFLRRRYKYKSDSQHANSQAQLPPMEEIIQPFTSPNPLPNYVFPPVPSMTPLRPLYYIPPTGDANNHNGHSSPNLLSSSVEMPTAAFKHASQNSQSTSALSYTSGNSSAPSSVPLRDVYSGARFQGGELPIFSPGYTAA